MLRSTFDTGVTRPIAWRRLQLLALRKFLVEESPALERALATDLGKPAAEARLTELAFTVAEIDHTLKHLARWMKPRRTRIPWVLSSTSRNSLQMCLDTCESRNKGTSG